MTTRRSLLVGLASTAGFAIYFTAPSLVAPASARPPQGGSNGNSNGNSNGGSSSSSGGSSSSSGGGRRSSGSGVAPASPGAATGGTGSDQYPGHSGSVPCNTNWVNGTCLDYRG